MVETGTALPVSEFAPIKPCCADAEFGADCAPGKPWRPAPPVRPKTSEFYKTCNLPKRFDHPAWFYGYGIQRKPPVHPCFVTTSSDYGRFPPTIHTVPTSFFPNNQQFSNALLKAGMYRNYSLNSSIDRSPV